MTGLSEATGQFIHLQTLVRHSALRGREARLPSWQEVRARMPELIRGPPRHMRDRLFVTHRWDDRGHPDPTGWQLRALQELGDHYRFADPEICLWYDYMSLPQAPRTAAESKIFGGGLDHIRTTVGECENVMLVSAEGHDEASDLVAMRHRGWIVFELLLARRAFRIPLPLYQRQGHHRVQRGRDAQNDRDAVVSDLNQLVPFESWQLIHRWFERQNIVCTNGADLRRLAKLLHRELTEKKRRKPDFIVQFGKEMLLTQEQLDTLEFMETSHLSGCYPRIYLDSRRDAPGRTWRDPVAWLCSFAPRPALPELDVWTAVTAEEVGAMRIDRMTGRSPMYPGIRFEIDAISGRLRPSFADLAPAVV